MKDKIAQFDEILTRYKFKEPVPGHAREFAGKNKNKDLTDVLKKFGEYSFFYGLVLWLYYFLSKMGLGLSIIQAKILFVAASLVLGVSVSTGGYFVVKSIQTVEPDFQKPVVENLEKQGFIKDEPEAVVRDSSLDRPTPEKTGKKDDIAPTITMDEPVSARLGINRLSANGVDEKLVSDVTAQLYKKLSTVRGKDRVVYRKLDGTGKSVNRQLVGTVGRLGSTVVLSVRVIDGENVKILFNKTITIKEGDDINKAVNSIVQMIDRDQSLW
ncbi:MAG: hypothetical protein GY754_14475 [bacterium]|nr:hypothetical protein [bacterium]